MNRSAREGKSVKRFERSSGTDIALYKNYLLYKATFTIHNIIRVYRGRGPRSRGRLGQSTLFRAGLRELDRSGRS